MHILSLPTDVLLLLCRQLLVRDVKRKPVGLASKAQLVTSIYSYHSLRDIKNASLVCKAFRNVCRPLIFEHCSVKVAKGDHLDEFELLPDWHYRLFQSLTLGMSACQG